MNNKFKNFISFMIAIVFILSGVFLVYKTGGNVVVYLLENISNKSNQSDEADLNDNNIKSTEVINTKETRIETKIETESIINIKPADEPIKEKEVIVETTEEKVNELIVVNTSTSSNTKSNLTYRKTYVDPNNPDIMHVIDGNYDKDFFKNSLFIGDSRVDGLKLYANVPDAHYFCSTGLTEYTLFKEPLVVQNVGNIYLEFLIGTNKYDKIYFQMGINSLGTNFKNHVKEFGNAVKKIHELTPSSKIYIVSNMHVVKRRSEESKYITNANIDLFNNEIKKFADNKDIFYIDVNKFLDDETTGILNEEYTRDGVHLLPKYYDIEMDVFYNYSRQ